MCFPPAGGDKVGGGGNDARGSNVRGNSDGGGSNYSKEASDDGGRGSRGREPRRDRAEAGGSRDGAGVCIIERMKQDGEETITQNIRPLSSSPRVHTEAGKLSVGRYAVGDLGEAEMTSNETGEPNNEDLLGPLTLPLPLSPEAAVRTEGDMHGREHAGGIPGVRVGPDGQGLLSASGTVPSCSPLLSLGKWLTAHQPGRIMLSFVRIFFNPPQIWLVVFLRLPFIVQILSARDFSAPTHARRSSLMCNMCLSG